MTEQASSHKNIFAALSAAQSEMGPVVKGATNPHFRSKYADLADVMSVAIPALNANGICVWHNIIHSEGAMMMRTTLTHGESETHIECDVPLLVQKNDMQGMKSATTYAKRIGVESLTGIAPEDDDGNAASAAPVKKSGSVEKAGDAQVSEAIAYIKAADSIEDLRIRFGNIPDVVRRDASVISAKDVKKAQFETANRGDAPF